MCYLFGGCELPLLQNWSCDGCVACILSSVEILGCRCEIGNGELSPDGASLSKGQHSNNQRHAFLKDTWPHIYLKGFEREEYMMLVHRARFQRYQPADIRENDYTKTNNQV